MENIHKAAAANLNQAREEAREVGEQRRLRVRERVQDMKTQGSEDERQEGERNS